MINSQDIKNGVCIRMDGRLYFVIEFLHVKPGKGNTIMRVKFKDVVDGQPTVHIVETTPGRVIVNQYVPEEIGYQNVLMKKGAVKAIISKVIKTCGVARAAQFLDDIKDLGYYRAFKGGLSFNLNDIIIFITTFIANLFD